MDVTPHTKTANESSQGACADHRHEPAISAGKTGLASVGAQAATVIDPVCGMTVEPKTAKHQAEQGDHIYYFCSAGCRTKFLANPLQYLKPKSAAVEPGVEGTIYTCPMHPQIRQVGPGSCPICGMALEPETVTLDKTPNPELADMTRRFLDRPCSDTTGVYARDGRSSDGPPHLARSADVKLGSARTRNPGRAVGGMAVFRARLAVIEN